MWRMLQALELKSSSSDTGATTTSACGSTMQPQQPAPQQQSPAQDAQGGGVGVTTPVTAITATNDNLQPQALTPGPTPAPSGSSALISERSEKALACLEELLAAFPMDNPQDEHLHDMLERIRGRFKTVASGMGLLTDYFPRGDASLLAGE